MPNKFGTPKHTKSCVSQELLIAKPSAETQKTANVTMYSHIKNQILTQRNRIVIYLTCFFRLSSLGSHLGVLMSCDLTDGGPTFAQRVKLFVPVLTLRKEVHFSKVKQDFSKVLPSLGGAL